jgi:hypothetical protein
MDEREVLVAVRISDRRGGSSIPDNEPGLTYKPHLTLV